MNWFTDFFTGKTFRPTVSPTPAPDPVPVPVPDAVPAPPSGSTVITIENYNKNTRSWRSMAVPFFGSAQMDIKPALSGKVSRNRVTVKQGKLTITSATGSGPHNPAITKFKRNQVFNVGESFLIECSMGPQTVNRPNGHDQVNYAVYSRELGQIFSYSVTVAYV